jgi:hypothetical protein
MKFGIDQYNKKTPAKIRKIAKAVKGFCVSIGSAELIMGNKDVALYVLIVGALATEVFEFFGDDN